MDNMEDFIKEWNSQPANWTNNRRRYNGLKPRRKIFNKTHRGYIDENLTELFVILSNAIMEGRI